MLCKWQKKIKRARKLCANADGERAVKIRVEEFKEKRTGEDSKKRGL